MLFDQAGFGLKLREIRKKNGMTQEQMSNELHISIDQLRKMECGARGPSLNMLISIAEWSGVSTDWLLLGYDYMLLHSRHRLEDVLDRIYDILADMPDQGRRQ